MSCKKEVWLMEWPGFFFDYLLPGQFSLDHKLRQFRHLIASFQINIVLNYFMCVLQYLFLRQQNQWVIFKVSQVYTIT